MSFTQRFLAHAARGRWLFTAALLSCFLIAGKLVGGVLVAPTVIFISDINRTGRLEVQNTANEPREVTVRLAYGLPQSDSLGNIYVNLKDSNITDPKAAVDWIKAFPRKVIVPPGGTQVIRMVARPPKDLPDGEYWARVVVTSREGTTELPSPEGDQAIETRLNMVMQTALMLKYRNGECMTRLELTHRDAWLTEEGMSVLLGMSNLGNASYMGILTCTVTDADNQQVLEKYLNIAVYDHLRRRVDLEFDRSEYRAPFKVAVSVSSEGRTDVAPEDLIVGNDVSYTMTVE
ncbi:hypothetical protein GF420_02615 [candidate division GN15 bacterium]|nr:hypothetical protein [candidate division GN15 bacterium]